MEFKVNIKAGLDTATSYVNASGSDQHIITDTERRTFGLQDSQLKGAVEKYFGKSPNDAYLHNPTPWDNLYTKYNWTEVQTVLVVENATIMGITSEPVIVATKTFENKSSKKANFNCDISDQVTNSAESNWSQTDTINISQAVSYKIGFLGSGGGGETSMSYEHAWGKGGSESQSVTVGSTSGVTVELDPGECVKATLIATRGVMRVKIVYKAYLIGGTAVNYNPTYKDHHFWCLDINAVMSAAAIITSRVFTEDIEIGYYSNASIKIEDMDGQVRKMFSMASRPAQLE